jgi:hypothetical protein
MAGIDLSKLLASLREADAFSEDQLGLLEAAGEEPITWSADDFAKQIGLSRLEAMAAHRLVREAFGDLGVTQERQHEIPKQPPYLLNPGKPATFGKPLDDGTKVIKTAASVGDYDPADPMQFQKIGDQYYRWDGQRTERHPFGQPHEVAFVDHRVVNGVMVPDSVQASAALAKGQEWFHKGYGCWIRWNGKRSVEVGREALTAARNVTGPRARAIA